jgi:hypothetical protein
LLVGTKEDLIKNCEEFKKNEISIQIDKFLNENKLNFIEVSSKTRKNVKESISKLNSLCYNEKVNFIVNILELWKIPRRTH